MWALSFPHQAAGEDIAVTSSWYFNAPATASIEAEGYLARVQLNSPEELEKALLRADELFRLGLANQVQSPLAFVLHGPEVAIFFRENYERYKPLVDLAARLSALGVIEVNVCRTRMGVLGREPSVLLPFVGTVPFGPAEIDRLINEEKFVYF